MRLSWTDNNTNPQETGYVVERSTDGVTFTQIGTAPGHTGGGSPIYIDLTVPFGVTATYRVASVVPPLGTSGFSNTAQVVVPAQPAAPTSVVATSNPNIGNQRPVRLDWADMSTNETGFTIQRATNTAFTTGFFSANVPANTSTFIVQNLGRGTSYYIRIRANNGTLVSSAWVNATPFPITTNP